MKTSMNKTLLIVFGSLILSALVGCVSGNHIKQNKLVVYDFGLSDASNHSQPLTSTTLLEKPVTADALNHNKIRYRLNYQNPSRVFYYAESRWATTPSELLASKINQIVNFNTTSTNCSLKLKIEAFDHVFRTTSDSDGVIQLSASVIERKTQKLMASQLITETVTATSSDATGGTAALQKASETALKKAIEWSSLIASENELCQ
jgi:cholesterol transport system auxiliary component